MRETVACGRWRREDLSAAGWKAVFSVAERSAAGRGKVWCVGVFGCVAGKEKWSCCLGEGERPWLRGRRRSWLSSEEVGERLRGENGGLCGEESPAGKGDGFPG